MEEAKNHANKSIPEVFKNWKKDNWGHDTINNSIFIGPIDAVEYKSSYDDLDISIEIWKLDKYYPELSFNTSKKEADDKHNKIISLLDDNNWLLHDDVLKTQLIYDKQK